MNKAKKIAHSAILPIIRLVETSDRYFQLSALHSENTTFMYNQVYDVKEPLSLFSFVTRFQQNNISRRLIFKRNVKVSIKSVICKKVCWDYLPICHTFRDSWGRSFIPRYTLRSRSNKNFYELEILKPNCFSTKLLQIEITYVFKYVI